MTVLYPNRCYHKAHYKGTSLYQVKYSNLLVEESYPMFIDFFQYLFNSFCASDDFCCLLVTFANSLSPDKD